VKTPTDAGLWGLIQEYHGFRSLVARQVRERFRVGDRVSVPRTHGGTSGVVDGYHGSDIDAVWVRLDVPAGHEQRRALVPAAELIDANRG
jgi:hypothetical protein